MPKKIQSPEDKALAVDRKMITDRLFNTETEQTERTTFDHIANGGDLITLSETWGIKYSDLAHFMQATEVRKNLLKNAYQARNEWCQQKILREVERLAMVDIRELYDESGILKPMSEWPDGAAAAVTSIETDEIFERDGKNIDHVGNKKKLKLSDKLKALEMIGRGHGLFAQNVKVTTQTYEQFLASTYGNDLPPSKEPNG